MKINKHLYIFGLSLAISACTSVTIIPASGDQRTIISNASTGEKAVKIASYKADRICSVEGRRLKITEVDTIYQGVDKKQKEIIKSAKTILPKSKTARKYLPAAYTYKATLTFRCVR